MHSVQPRPSQAQSVPPGVCGGLVVPLGYSICIEERTGYFPERVTLRLMKIRVFGVSDDAKKKCVEMRVLKKRVLFEGNAENEATHFRLISGGSGNLLCWAFN